MRMEIEATGLPEVSKGRITQGRFKVSALRDEINLFAGVRVIGG